ncbi:extracellular solute-binding protein family 1 [halophilic archaeon DL31]|jgi:putative spermidine/putrescine transport system substrate-binding protein|nr:extracellular solute-binding protein family 1 [halophilic archaeon DL31]
MVEKAKEKWEGHGVLRREYLQRAGAFGAAAAGIATAGCLGGGGGSGKPSNLSMGTWGGTWQDLMIEAVVTPFEEETDIGIEYVLGDNTPRLNKIIAQKDNPPVDVSQQDGSGLVRGSNEDLWHELDEELVPSLSKVPDTFKGDDWVMQIFAASSLLFNPEQMDTAPTSWDVYLNSDYQGKVGLFTEDPTHDVLAFSLAQTDGESFKDVEAAFSMYEEVVKEMDPVYITSSEEYGKMFEQEEVYVGRYWSARAAQWQSDGRPVRSVIPDAGAMSTNFGNAIPKNISENKLEWAGELIDYTLREQAAKVIAENMYYTNPIPSMKYPESVQDKLVSSEDLENLNVPDFDWIAENRGSWRERANELINQHG